ncbi:cullin family protein [Ancylostoma duodenale]|uniref:Cullin family protein n=1 Tax=Ancylostoma duodenale TaxID=51022 RepID=A0A0C2FQJ3_9BILA|nr:cullin family protein [Ancylostoma duodenale]
MVSRRKRGSVNRNTNKSGVKQQSGVKKQSAVNKQPPVNKQSPVNEQSSMSGVRSQASGSSSRMRIRNFPVLHKYGERLYTGLKQVVEDHLRNYVRVKIVESLDSGNFLEVMNEAWSDHTTAMVMIRDILMYMDRVYVEQNKVEQVFHLGLAIFRFVFFSFAEVHSMVEQCIREESERAKRYLDPQTESKVLDVLENVLIKDHMHTVVNMEHSGVHVMLSNDKVCFFFNGEFDQLASLYGLLQRVENGLNVMADAMSRYLHQTGVATVREDCERTPVVFVEENDENAEKLLDKAMVLFRFLQEKDVFEKYYKQHMARRLLLDKSISDDMERMMISKLKTECGCHFTLKLENMFRDKELWATQATSFKEYRENVSYQNFSLHLKLIQNLPLQASTSDAPPRECRKEENKILMVNTHQMVILMCFNSHPRLTFQALLDHTNIAERELKRNLQSLAMGKPTQRVLCRKGKGKDIGLFSSSFFFLSFFLDCFVF